MYAIIQTGGKQYRVSEGESLRIERIPGQVGDSVQIDEVLMVGGEDLQVGAPRLECQVQATITEQGKGAKVIVGKFKRRKMYRRKRGHRQHFTQVSIDAIGLPGAKPAKKEAAKKPQQAEPAKQAKPKKQQEKKAPKVQAKAAAPQKAAARKEAKASKPAKKAASKPAKEAASKPAKEAASKPAKEAASKPAKEAASKPAKKAASKPAKEAASKDSASKKKATRKKEARDEG